MKKPVKKVAKKAVKKVTKKATKKVAKKTKPAVYIPDIPIRSLVKRDVLRAIKELEIDFTKSELSFEFGPSCHINRDGFLTSNNLKKPYATLLILVGLIYTEMVITPLNNRFGVDVIARNKRK